MFKLPNKCSSCLKIATWRCQAKHRTSIRDFYTKIKPPTFPAPHPPKSSKPPPPLCSPEGSIKMNTPKILMESGDLTCISKTLKKFTGGSPPMSIPKAIKLDFKAIRSARQVNNNRTVYQSIQNNDKKEDFGKNINKRELSRTLEDLDMSFEDFWEKCREDEHFCKLSARCLSKRASRQGSKDETKQLRICNLTTMQCNAV